MPLDLLELAGGRETVLGAAFDLASCLGSAPQVIVETVIQGATKALTGQVMATITDLEAMFSDVLGNGPRPAGQSAAAEAWDEEFEAFALPSIEQLAATAGVNQKWVVENLAGHLNIGEADVFASKVTEGMIAAALVGRASVNKRLSYIGFTPGEVEEAWHALNASEPVEAPERYDFLTPIDSSAPARVYAPEDVTEQAVIHKPEKVPALPTPPVIANLGSGDGPPKRRGRQNSNASWTLPADIFTGMRSVGIADKEAAEHCGIPRSTYTRIAGGVAGEIGLTDAQATKLVEYAVSKRQKLNEVLAMLQICGLEAL